ncbi:hypothetical protein N8788_04605 [Candidatus Pelagibacter sp.]|jgi:surface carbohydrate biosynthesis protein|nr:hypothetical protein [Candidatus Pelagibacter sp.]
MNIYLHIEIALRELDGKLLLATLSAARGHNVIISDISSIKRGLRSGVLPPGIFHVKSLTPSSDLISIHEEMVNSGTIITSLDEESGILDQGYKGFADERYSDKTIEQSSAIFGWGDDDVKILKQIYPKHSSKIYKTGSPRIDLCKSQFSKKWVLPSSAPSKPFLLISSNLHTANFKKPFHEWGGFKPYQLKKNISYFKSDPILFKKQFDKVSEDTRKLAAFVEAVHHLSNTHNGYDIVLRPHPLENIDAWKVYLRGISNVHVIREGPINPWINNAFAIMHNSCTTAIEATVFGKEVITYIPFQQDHSWGEVANQLGHRVETLEDLSNKVNALFSNLQSANNRVDDKPITDSLLKKIYLDKNELAAEKILKVWEKLVSHEISKSSSLLKFELLLKTMKIKNFLGNVYKDLFMSKNKRHKEDYKFPSLDIKKIRESVSSLQRVLKIDKKLECKLLNDKTILIKKV